MKHAFLSPSASHRWVVCPGAAKANADKPYTESEAALEGSTAHALLEVCLLLDMGPETFLGARLAKNLMLIDQEMVDGVGYALDFIASYLAEHPKARVYAEYTVYPGALLELPEDAFFGTSDVIIDNYPVECVALDYKHGTWRVEAKGNTQLQSYHVGMKFKRGRYRRYRNVIVQPRCRGAKPIREHSLTDAQLMQWVNDTLLPAATEALGKDPKRVPGSHCRYCYVDGRCKAQAKAATEVAMVEFASAKDISATERAELLGKLPMVKVFMEGFLKASLDMLQKGEHIPGYALGYNPPRRIWLDVTDADTKLKTMGLVALDERQPRTILSPSQAEKALKAKKKWPKKPRGAKADPNPFADLIGYTDKTPCIEKVTGGSEFTDNEA